MNPFKKSSSHIWLESVGKKGCSHDSWNKQKKKMKQNMGFIFEKINCLSIDLFRYDYKDVIDRVPQ